jgi:hypothetical protein
MAPPFTQQQVAQHGRPGRRGVQPFVANGGGRRPRAETPRLLGHHRPTTGWAHRLGRMPVACGVPSRSSASQRRSARGQSASRCLRRCVGEPIDGSTDRRPDGDSGPCRQERRHTDNAYYVTLRTNGAADHSPPSRRGSSPQTTSFADATTATLRPVSAAAGSEPARRAGSSRRRPAHPTDRGRHTPQARAVAAHVRPGPGFVPGPTSGPSRVSTSCRGLRGDAHGKPSGEPSGAPCPTLPSRGSSRPGVLIAPDRSCRRCPASVARSRRQRRQQRCPGAHRVSRRTLKRTDRANHCV